MKTPLVIHHRDKVLPHGQGNQILDVAVDVHRIHLPAALHLIEIGNVFRLVQVQIVFILDGPQQVSLLSGSLCRGPLRFSMGMAVYL